MQYFDFGKESKLQFEKSLSHSFESLLVQSSQLYVHLCNSTLKKANDTAVFLVCLWKSLATTCSIILGKNANDMFNYVVG